MFLQVTCTLIWIALAAGSPGDSALTPKDSIPKLPEHFEYADYKALAQSGTLLPDRIRWDSLWVRVGETETRLRRSLADSAVTCSDSNYRTRQEQWGVIRELLYKSNFSMHYYILANLYYYKQLHGQFKTCQWPIAGVGLALIHLHAPDTSSAFKVWLIELRLEPTVADSVSYQKGDHLSIMRSGTPAVEWNIERNSVRILGPAAGAEHGQQDPHR